ncbi:MAG: hypothetical protein MAG453_02116 [Calditrichaeota bacterium]|nr:hypothetical protein [Calditrichota bacterium]
MLRIKPAIIVIGLALFAGAGRAEVTEEINGHGSIDWSDRTVRAVGISVSGGAGGRAGQIRAAELDALRQILETVNGIRLSSETTVEEFMLSSDRIRTRIEGVARNFRRVGDPVYQPDGSIELTVEMDLTGPDRFLDAVLPSAGERAKPLYDTAPPGSGVYTGLIVDARGLGVRPAIAPRIHDEQGRVIYGDRYVDRDWAVRHGMAGYAKDPVEARADERIAPNPLVIKANRATGANRADVVISNEDARLLHAVEKHLTFLQQCRVIFLVD